MSSVVISVGEVELEESSGMRCCLICNGDTLSTQSSAFGRQQQPLLSKHLQVILLLKQVFELPSEQLIEFLRKSPNVENWITVCENCEQLVNEFKTVHEQMISLKMKIIGTMKGSLTVHEDTEGPILNVADECRRFVEKHEYGPAQITHKDPPDEVKQEMNDDTTDDDNHFPTSPPISPQIKLATPDDPEFNFQEEHNIPASNRKSPTRKSARISVATANVPNIASELPCPKCDQSFPTKETLNCHITNNHKYSPDVASRTCTVCGLLLFDKKTCQRHLVRKHGYQYSQLRTPKPDYGTQTKCNQCSKSFKTPYRPYRHTELVHNNNLDHLCDLCGKRFTSKPGLDKHREFCGTRRLEDGSLKKRTKCPVEGCNIYYLRDDILQKHVEEEHRRPPTWKCSQCSKRFPSEVQLLRHEKVDHGISKFICEICGREFKSKVYLSFHLKNSHKVDK